MLEKKLSLRKLHETQPDLKATLYSNSVYVDDERIQMSYIEDGRPPQKVRLSSLRAPVRLFTVFYTTAMVLMGVISILISMIK